MTDTITLPRSVVEQALKALYEADSLMEHHTNIELRRSALVELRAALEQPQVNSPEIPEGWRLVPEEPTEDMLNSVAWPGCAATDWEHMLAAAPQPPVVEQPPVEQEPVAWIEHEWSGSGLRHLHFERPAPTVRDEVVRPVWTPLYTHPQNLNCKSTQARLATLWGYVKPQPKREPLTDEAEHQCPYPKANPSTRNAWLDGWEAAERAHGIGGEA